MVKLTEALVLSRSKTKDIASVRKLNFWGTELDDVNIVRSMPNIEVASLSANSITTLADFEDCPNLQELYVRKNEIRDLNEVFFLKKLPKLKSLWLADNPCALGNRYRMTVLKNLPSLTKLDNIAVGADERATADEEGIELVRPSGIPATVPAPADTDQELKAPLPSEHDDSSHLHGGASGDKFGITDKDRCAETIVTRPRKSTRNSNVLQAVLCLIKELDEESLQRVSEEVQNILRDV